MGWHSDRIGLGSNQWEWFGHRDRRGCWNKFNSDDHNNQTEHCQWLGNSHGDIARCCIDSNIWHSSQNSKWFHRADREL